MRRLAGNGGWILFAVWLTTAAAALVLTIATWSVKARPFADPAIGNARDIMLGAVFAVVGVVIAAKRPGNAVGWLLLAVAISLSLNVLSARYAVYGLLRHPGSLPGASVVAELGASTWLLLISAFALLMVVFPGGHLPSRRWRPVVWGLIICGISTWIGNTLVPGPMSPPLDNHDNPIGIGALRSAGGWLSTPGWLIMVVFIAAGISLVRRFRAAEGDERLQYKWFAFAALLFPLMMIGTLVLEQFVDATSTADTIASSLTGLVATAIPVATAVAVLRYRLYDIDRIVSRTVVYGVLTVVLGGAYVGLILLSEALFASFAGGSSFAVALSTLAVAGLFLPVRRRVQGVVDRRFYRSKIDAEAMLARFGTRLRDEADLDALVAELDHVVRDAMQPTLVGVWLRNDFGTAVSYKGGT